MRTRFLLLIAVGVAGCGLAAAGAPSERPEGVVQAAGPREAADVEQLAQRLAGGGVTLVDVRTDAEWASGHVPGAVHVPLDQLTPDHPALAALPKDRPVHLVCASGRRSAAAADRLSAAGWHTVNVEGGTRAWIASGRSVE